MEFGQINKATAPKFGQQIGQCFQSMDNGSLESLPIHFV